MVGQPPKSKTSEVSWRLPLAAGAALVCAIAVIVVLIERATAFIDAAERDKQSSIVDGIIEEMSRDFGAVVHNFAHRDSIRDVAAGRTSEDWAREHLFANVGTEFGVTDVILLAPDNRVAFGYEAEEEDGGEFEQFGELDASIAVLAHMARRAAVDAKAPPINGFVRIGGELHIAAAHVVVPKERRHDSAAHGQAVIIMMADVDSAMFAEFSRAFHVPGFTFTEKRPPASRPQLAVKLLGGGVAGYFTWDQQAPGRRFMDSVVVWVGVLLLGLSGLIALIIRDAGLLSAKIKKNLEHAAEARAAGREKDKFLKVISHELRTPLNAVIGFAEIMEQEMMGQHVVPSYKDYSKQIRKSGVHLLTLINDMLLLVQLERGEYAAVSEAIDSAEAVERAVGALADLKEAVDVSVEIMPSDGQRLVADRRGLNAVLNAILSNAIKFSNRGGRVTVSFAAADSASVEIVVRDDGIGMSPEQVETIGLAFNQAESALARQNGGLGIGLALTSNFVELMRGRLTFKSVKGVGTVVRLVFPRAVENVPVPAVLAAAAS